MLTRRDFSSLLAPAAMTTLLFPASLAGAQEEGAEALVAPPFEVGRADFNGSWTLLGADVAKLVAASPDIPDGFAQAYGAISFSSASDIDSFFNHRVGSTFNNWFNKKITGTTPWGTVSIAGKQAGFDSGISFCRRRRARSWSFCFIVRCSPTK
jgi:hypothetical protein